MNFNNLQKAINELSQSIDTLGREAGDLDHNGEIEQARKIWSIQDELTVQINALFDLQQSIPASFGTIDAGVDLSGIDDWDKEVKELFEGKKDA